MRRALSLAVAVALATLAVRCSTFSEESGGGGGGDAAAAQESAAADVATDATDASESCAHVLLSDDFERSTLLPAPSWDFASTPDAGELSLAVFDPAHGTSLRAILPGPNDAGPAYLEKAVGLVERVTFSYRMRFDAPTQRDVGLNSLELADSQTSVFVFAAPDGKRSLREQRSDLPARPSVDYPCGMVDDRWHDYRITLDLAQPPHVQLLVDGVAQVDANLQGPFKPGVMRARGGVSFTGKGPASTVWIDDVEVCLER
jgi:hypothetical protein